MVNKGQIHREVGTFREIVQIQSNHMRWEIRYFSILKRSLQEESMKVRSRLIWISIHGEIKEQNLGRKFNHNERELIKFLKINLI